MCTHQNEQILGIFICRSPWSTRETSVRDSEAALGSRPAIMHALRSVLSVCSVSALPGATVTTTTVRALSACKKSY